MTNHKPDIRKSNPCPPCPPAATPFEKCVYWLGIGLGSGLPKKAAGTWGTVGGLIIALPMLLLGFWGFLIITIIGCLIGSYICGKTSDLMNTHDDPHIVFDEWVGMWIALLPIVFLMDYKALDAFTLMNILLYIIMPFILFRFFDIIKPFPIKWVDKNVSGGFGILIDDILAGIMSAVVMLVIMSIAL
ncbi:phosphatidylglycerophosphatase A family protein [Moraxella ovis]|uniref:phosphatidylglycerophosphatase A family protein n=1 Tax=Moraxella ovis TaxID=29433 RepID=UPI000D9AA488|nr:phosphatidylglycerophosphatase A [Moraxella ovis]SPX85457.1 Phosphatidylglycerophosphatase A [Moraxella ovis]STZ06240.1 Phosphatidylglycerophosphatase A [Moraxella ovis]